MRRAIVTALLVLAAAATATTASAATAWEPCSRTADEAAARSAGLARALDRDPALKRTFSGQTAPSDTYQRASTSLCGDFDGDGRTDRALLYQCCSVSSPAPWVVLSKRDGSRWQIVFSRLHDTTFKLEGDGGKLRTEEPRYAKADPNCCPSALRIGKLRWTGEAFKRSFRITDA
jgi:hypothetical protein